MKQYLKMADVLPNGVVISPLHSEIQQQYADHAINSHDELVQMNQELLAALKRVVGDVRALADQSYGVHGLHQNGDLAPWNSLFQVDFLNLGC